MKPIDPKKAPNPRQQVGPANPAAPQPPAAETRHANGQSAAASPVVHGQLHPMPQARQIQNDWHQSVEQLNTEIRELRTMLENLLREIRALIQDYSMQTELQPFADALTTAVNDSGSLIRSIDRVLQTMRGIDTSAWDETARKKFLNEIDRLATWAAQLSSHRKESGNGNSSETSSSIIELTESSEDSLTKRVVSTSSGGNSSSTGTELIDSTKGSSSHEEDEADSTNDQ